MKIESSRIIQLEDYRRKKQSNNNYKTKILTDKEVREEMEKIAEKIERKFPE